jgi:hypothetical protein
MSWVPTWAVVEIMGHKVLAGWVTEEDLAGVKFLAVEVPFLPGQPEVREPRPAFRQLFGAAAIFSVSPCEEQHAREIAARLFPGQRVGQPLVTYAEQVGTDSDPEIDFDAEDVPFE